MSPMDLAPISIQPGRGARRPMARAQVLVQVKFMGLPIDETPGDARFERRAPDAGGLLSRFISRVIGRLAAARP